MQGCYSMVEDAIEQQEQASADSKEYKWTTVVTFIQRWCGSIAWHHP